MRPITTADIPALEAMFRLESQPLKLEGPVYEFGVLGSRTVWHRASARRLLERRAELDKARARATGGNP